MRGHWFYLVKLKFPSVTTAGNLRSRRRTTVVAVRDVFGSKNLRGQTSDEFKYAPEKRLNGQSEMFYYTANENSEIITNCALTKAVSMLKNKDMLICLPFV